MNERDFAYWLQGYFEILEANSEKYADALQELTSDQIKCIKAHIELVRTTTKSPSPLLNSIEVLLDYDISAMRKVLNAHFEHVIDPEHPNQEQANTVHNSGRPPWRPGGTNFRC